MLQAHSYTLVRHKGPCLTWFFWNIALTGGTEFNILKGKRSYLFRYDNKWKVREKKKQKKLTSHLGSVRLGFLVGKGTTTVAMQIFWFFISLGICLSKDKPTYDNKLY